MAELMGAAETAAAIAAGSTSAQIEVDAAIARIEARDGKLNAVVVRRFDAARKEAQAADAEVASGMRKPLLGVPITVKESYNVAGLPTTWGMAEFKGHEAKRDSTVAARLKAAGAIIIGKTNVPPMLADWQSANPVYGVTRNPHDPARVPGGSSGGSGAALAAGYVPLEYGSDIGGSIRVPASFNGVWGLKTTFGLVPLDGHALPIDEGHPPEMSVCGPLARSAADAAMALGLTADHPLDLDLPRSLEGVRIAAIASHPVSGTRSIISAACAAALNAAERAGATIVRDAKFPDLEAMHRDYIRLLLTVLGRRQPPPDDVEPVTLEGWWQMLDQRQQYRREWAELFADVDAVFAPVSGITAFPHDGGDSTKRVVDIDGRAQAWGDQLGWVGMANYTGLPAAAMPLAKDADGLPFGMQVMGPMFGDLKALKIAGLTHAALDLAE